MMAEAPQLPYVYSIDGLGIKLNIRPLGTEDSFEQMTSLLHRSYQPLAEMGLRFLATHQDSATTKERCLTGYTFVAEHGKQLVATLTLYPSSPTSHCDYYRRPDVWHFGQFAVHPSLQKHGIGSVMMDLAEAIAAHNDAKELALDTSEQALHLIDYYQKRGYEFREYVQWDITNYRSIIVSKRLG